MYTPVSYTHQDVYKRQYKACTYIAGKTMASTICGASCPVVITSRADTPDSKYYSILMAGLRCIKGC